jgi:hypothetical protein
MKRLVLWAPPLALLAACSGSSVSLQPGQWETTIRMTSIEVPGAPEAMVAQMRTQMANQVDTRSQCITPQEAANPAGNMLNPSGGGQGCTFTDNIFAGGVINVNGTCAGPGGQGSARMTLAGSYTATTMEGRVSAEVTAPPGAAPPGTPQTVRMSGTMTSRRTGDCPAS